MTWRRAGKPHSSHHLAHSDASAPGSAAGWQATHALHARPFILSPASLLHPLRRLVLDPLWDEDLHSKAITNASLELARQLVGGVWHGGTRC